MSNQNNTDLDELKLEDKFRDEPDQIEEDSDRLEHRVESHYPLEY